MLKRTSQLVMIACLLVGSSWAANDSFVGDWKLNPSKSKVIDQMKADSPVENEKKTLLTRT